MSHPLPHPFNAVGPISTLLNRVLWGPSLLSGHWEAFSERCVPPPRCCGGWLVDWLVGWLVACVGWLVALVGWLVGSPGWLVGWLVGAMRAMKAIGAAFFFCTFFLPLFVWWAMGFSFSFIFSFCLFLRPPPRKRRSQCWKVCAHASFFWSSKKISTSNLDGAGSDFRGFGHMMNWKVSDADWFSNCFNIQTNAPISPKNSLQKCHKKCRHEKAAAILSSYAQKTRHS